MTKDEQEPLEGRITRKTTMKSKMVVSFSVVVSTFATVLTIVASIGFGALFHKGLSGFSKQVNAFVKVGDFGFLSLQLLIILLTSGFVFYLLFVYLTAVKIVHCVPCFGSPFILFLASCSSQFFLVFWALIMCIVSAVTLGRYRKASTLSVHLSTPNVSTSRFSSRPLSTGSAVIRLTWYFVRRRKIFSAPPQTTRSGHSSSPSSVLSSHLLAVWQYRTVSFTDSVERRQEDQNRMSTRCRTSTALQAMEEPTSSERLCLVCSEKTSGCHFGIDACRACSAFFRRSVLENKVYHCRTGGSCTIHKSIRCLCRKCRLKKCLDSGMQPSGVQGKRESVGSNKKIQEISVETSAFSAVLQPELPSMEEPQLLLNILKNHTELCAIRKATERALDPESYKSMETGGILAGMSHGTSRSWSIFFRSQIPTVLEFVTKSFEETQELDEQERWILLKPFLVYIWWIDACHRTYKRIPRDQFANLCIMSETTYFDVNRCEDWFEKDTFPTFLKQDLAKFIKKEMSADRQRSTFLMSDMQIKDVEYAALLGLLFWNSTVEECSERVHEIIRKGRARIYNDLGVYYRQSKEFLAPVRIGELLNIQSAVMVETIRCREDLEIFNLFDAFEKDDYFYQMIRNI